MFSIFPKAKYFINNSSFKQTRVGTEEYYALVLSGSMFISKHSSLSYKINP